MHEPVSQDSLTGKKAYTPPQVEDLGPVADLTHFQVSVMVN